MARNISIAYNELLKVYYVGRDVKSNSRREFSSPHEVREYLLGDEMGGIRKRHGLVVHLDVPDRDFFVGIIKGAFNKASVK